MSVNAILQGQQKPITTDTRTTLDGVLMGNGSTVDTMTVDAIPIDSSTNLVTSGGVKVAIDNLEDGTIPVALAENLTSDSAQSSADTFIERTTGGTASLSDGDGWIQLIRGTHTHTGYTPGSAVMTVMPASHSLTASIVEATFLSQVSGNSGTEVFSYNNGWNKNLATYGITLTNGTSPINGDYIQVDWEIIEDVVMTVTSPEEDITAEINDATFLEQVSGDSGTMTFSYTSSWDTNPASYGITITGTPTDGDSISVDWTITRTVTMAVVPIIHTLSATINDETFLGEMSSASGTFSFNYTSGWSPNPASYGITVTGSPISGDSISVAYVKEVRGTITQSNPLTFKSSGWNLYDHSKGYARVLKYSDTYGFGISGTYTSLKFSTTTTGGSTITVTDGRFTIPSDGYVIVTGGNATDTQIWMTWSDWTSQANGGTWEAYTESTVDFSSLMGSGNIFPYGLCEVGSYRDEINFSSGVAIQNVGRVDWSTSNLATVRTYGTDYEYDENYIYYGLSAPVTTTISVNNTVKAYDHGMEWFTNTTQEVYVQTLYGTNLKNKLERDVVTISQQNIEPDGQKQVKANIGAIDGVNENLIDNWYFGNPINQRGGSLYNNPNATVENPDYGIDRWYTTAANTIMTINSGWINLSGAEANLYQLLSDELLDSSYTISILVNYSVGDIQLSVYSNASLTTSLVNLTVPESNNNEPLRLYSATFTGKPKIIEMLRPNSVGGIGIVAVKLELGNKQTLARNYGTESNPDWRLTEIPDPTLERLKCYDRVGVGTVRSNQKFYIDGTYGSDTNPGTQDRPLQTIAAVIEKVPKVNFDGSVTIYCADNENPYPQLTITTGQLKGCEQLIILSLSSDDTKVTFAGASITNPGCDITLQYLTFTDSVTINKTNDFGRTQVSNCTFDNCFLNHSGPYCTVVACTFKNIATNFAINQSYGYMSVRGGSGRYMIITTTAANSFGIQAHNSGIVEVATQYLTLNMYVPSKAYNAVYTGRVFVDKKDVGGPTVANPNLLDNAFFIASRNGGFPINQRAKTTYPDAGYCIDRWILGYGTGNSGSGCQATLTVSNAGITLARTTSAGTAVLTQKLTRDMSGQQCTLSVHTNQGYFTRTMIPQTGAGNSSTFTFNDNLRGMYVNNTKELRIISEYDSIVLYAVKLELGAVDTLLYNDNGTLRWMEFPNYPSELAKCQQYYWNAMNPHTAAQLNVPLNRMAADNGTSINANLNSPVPMRAAPTITGTLQYVRGTCGTTVTNLSSGFTLSNTANIVGTQLQFTITHSSHSFLAYTSGLFGIFTSLTFSADL